MKMIRSSIPEKQRLLISISSVILLILSYFALSNYQYSINPDNTVIPTVSGFVEGFQKIFQPRGYGENLSWTNNWFITDVTASLWRLGISLFLSIIIGTMLGILMGCFTRVEAFFNWPLTFFCKITPTGAMSVFFALFGTDIKMFVSVIVFGITPSIAISVMQSIKSMPEQYIHKSYTLGGSTAEAVWTISTRYALPSIINTIRLAIGPAIIFLIASEGLAASSGFGYTIRMEGKLSHVNVVLIYLCMLAGFGFFADWMLKKARTKLCGWLGDNN